MNRSRTAAAMALAGLGAAGVVVTTASTAQPPAAKTIVLDLRGSEDTVIENGRRGFSDGDMFAGGDTVFDLRGERVGRVVGVCLLIDATRFRGQCTDTLALADGQIVLQGAVSFRERESHRAVLGGTGAYEGARGSATVRSVADFRDRLTLRLLP